MHVPPAGRVRCRSGNCGGGSQRQRRRWSCRQAPSRWRRRRKALRADDSGGSAPAPAAAASCRSRSSYPVTALEPLGRSFARWSAALAPYRLSIASERQPSSRIRSRSCPPASRKSWAWVCLKRCGCISVASRPARSARTFSRSRTPSGVNRAPLPEEQRRVGGVTVPTAGPQVAVQCQPGLAAEVGHPHP